MACEVENLGEITLTFQSQIVTLRSPNLRNKDSNHVERLQKQTRGGDLIIFAPSYWPKHKILEYEFDTLSYDNAIALRDFIKLSLGKIVSLLDFEGKVHSGIIITPDIEIIQNGLCDYATSFSFQVMP